MATTEEFRLPNTPPQGHIFPPPPPGTRNMQSFDSSEDQGKTHSRKPSLTINTRELVSAPPQQQFPPPPPPRAKAADTNGKPRSHSQPVKPLQLASGNLPGPPARQRDSLGAQSSTTPLHRSIFPQYNPSTVHAGESHSVSASRAATPSPRHGDFQSTYTHSVYSAARSPPLQHGALSQAFAASTEPSQGGLPSYRESMYGVPVVIQSAPAEVLDLWLLANGQDDQELALSYNLGLDCTDMTLNSELICLTSTAGAVYTLRATLNSLNITRTHPLHGANSLSIAAPTLYAPTESSQLMTTIFPVQSKIQAIDHAASLAVTHSLGRSQALTLEREAITKAHARTAAPVLFNHHTKSYYISLPVFSPSAAENDEAPVHHKLPIEINPNISIRVLEPPSAQSASNPILTMSLPAKTLIVHSHALAGVPSPYGVDILISAMMALLLHLHRTTELLSPGHISAPLESVPTFAPPPRIGDRARSGRSSSRQRDRSSSRSRAGSRLGGLLRPGRDDASERGLTPPSHLRANSRLSTHSAVTTLHGSPQLHPPSTPGLEKGLDVQLSERGTAPELNAAVTGLDLSRFQAYDLADPRLGGGTKVMLRVLYWSFGVLVWVLGVCVGVLAEFVVLLGSCGASRKQ